MLLVAAPAAPAKAQVGCDVIVYWDANFRGESWRTQRDQPYVGDHWNDQISSIRILSGYWEFFWDINYGGERLRLAPGDYAFVGNHWNDQISSFRCLHS
ncbi:MAG TPA: beta/gamma crystallin-related protein [Stellaceae bacterium]|nr:beta/gamma crystallin-related protein [Stellaceae bacterium]